MVHDTVTEEEISAIVAKWTGIPVSKLMHKLHELKVPACAITDRGNLFGGKCFSKYAADEGIKPILCSELSIHNEDSENLALSKRL